MLLDASQAVETLARLVRGSTSSRDTVRESLRLINASWLCVIAGVGLTLIGVYSIDVTQNVDGASQMAGEAWRQVVFATIGMLAGTFIALPHYRLLSILAWPGMVLIIGLLIFVLLPFIPTAIVRPRNGARGWISLGVTDFQPAEVAKIVYVLVVARYLRFRTQHRKFLGLIVPGLLTIPPVALITLQPDLGTASLFVPSLFAILVAAGARLRHLAIIVLCAALAAAGVYPMLQPHQKVRIEGMVRQIQGDRSSAQDINYQSFTAQTLIGSGQKKGVSDTAARAIVHYNSLPERHNDMIFSVVVARFGLVGALGVFALYLTWIAGALLVAASCREPFGRLLAVGLTGFIAAQMVINIGMNVGLVPIIGITLPFLSYGGSSMLTVWLMTGLVVNVALHRPRPPYRSSFEYAGDDEELFYATRPYGRSVGFGGGPSRGEIEFPRDLSPLPPTARFLELAQGYGIEFEPHDIERLGHYLALLLAGNSVTNLTGVRDPEVAWETLIFDALTLLPLLADLPEGGRCIDVGTGGGLPGLPLAIVSPQLRFTLLDATGKKIAFVRHAIEQLSLNNAEALQGRAEVLAANANTEHRAAYDVVVSRAVGRVAMLAELTTPLAKVGGTVLLVKGQRADEELAEAKQVLHALHVAHAGTVDTPTGRIVVLDKSRATPAKYPRIADVGRAKGPKR